VQVALALPSGSTVRDACYAYMALTSADSGPDELARPAPLSPPLVACAQRPSFRVRGGGAGTTHVARAAPAAREAKVCGATTPWSHDASQGALARGRRFSAGPGGGFSTFFHLLPAKRPCTYVAPARALGAPAPRAAAPLRRWRRPRRACSAEPWSPWNLGALGPAPASAASPAPDLALALPPAQVVNARRRMNKPLRAVAKVRAAAPPHRRRRDAHARLGGQAGSAAARGAVDLLQRGRNAEPGAAGLLGGAEACKSSEAREAEAEARPIVLHAYLVRGNEPPARLRGNLSVDAGAESGSDEDDEAPPPAPQQAGAAPQQAGAAPPAAPDGADPAIRTGTLSSSLPLFLSSSLPLFLSPSLPLPLALSRSPPAPRAAGAALTLDAAHARQARQAGR
jgi:hypothetical protein